MKYYLHDSNSFNDEKITELYLNFGYEGLGLFYTFLEKIANQEKPIKTSVLKSQLNIGKRLEKCWNFMESLGIIQSNNGESFNEQLLTFSEKYKIKSEKNTKRISEWRERQRDTKNVTRYESVSNATKVKISKVKISKVNIHFSEFWDLYDKKVGAKEVLEKKWECLSDSERTYIMAYIPKYKLSQPDKKFRKDPSTFLNQKAWNNELIGVFQKQTSTYVSTTKGEKW